MGGLPPGICCGSSLVHAGRVCFSKLVVSEDAVLRFLQ